MFQFVMGLVLGFSLGFILLALLTKSKEADELACHAIQQAPSLAEENLLVSRP
jgi:hypothetical protein